MCEWQSNPSDTVHYECRAQCLALNHLYASMVPVCPLCSVLNKTKGYHEPLNMSTQDSPNNNILSIDACIEA